MPHLRICFKSTRVVTEVVVEVLLPDEAAGDRRAEPAGASPPQALAVLLLPPGSEASPPLDDDSAAGDRDRSLDDALAATFPASDPVSISPAIVPDRSSGRPGERPLPRP